MRDTTAALVVIGNEILSGKVADTNSTFLAQQLRGWGVTLRRMVVIPDEVEVIAAAIRELAPTVDVLFTSGGVGPTHDDVTIEGVARGLGRGVVRHPAIEGLLRRHFGDRVNQAHLKLAEVVEGTELDTAGKVSFPTFRVENIYVLPGIPEIFREKVLALRERFAADPFHLRVVYTRELESAIAAHLNDTLAQFPELLLGSYPKLNDPDYSVRITLESKDRDYVERALAVLLGLLRADSVVRTE
ncbi:MAG: competence/damage-inducible protein A [Deltaproteobacteria bacterium]|nr:competence/damage-inducible protein A [Deltaproteobacteria bacterium]